MLIDNNVLSAFKAFADAKGSLAEASRVVGIHYMLMRKYSTGEVKKVNDENWSKLEPHLRPYLAELPSSPIRRVRGPVSLLFPNQNDPSIKPSEINLFLRLKKAGITEDIPAINLAVIERVVKLSEAECWEVGNFISQFVKGEARIVEEHTERPEKPKP